MPRQRQQPQDVLAPSVAQIAQAFARALAPFADADVVQRSKAKPVQRECPTADFAGDLFEGVVACLPAIGDAHQADAVRTRRPQQANRARGTGSLLEQGNVNSHRVSGAPIEISGRRRPQ